MRIKTGPLLVIGGLVVLVGLALILSPAPKPQTAEPAKEAEKPADTKKAQAQATQAKIDDIKKLIASPDPQQVNEGLKALGEAYTTARGAEKTELGGYIVSLTKASNPEAVRFEATTLLRTMRDVDPRVLVGLATTDVSSQVRESAIWAMTQFPPGGPTDAALKRLTQDPDPGIRSMAIIALTQVLSKSGQAGETQLVNLFGQYDNDASAKAIMELSTRGLKVVPLLIETLYKGSSGPQRHAAALALAMTCAGYNPSIDAFTKAAQVTHRVEAGHQLADSRAVAPLIWALQNDTWAPTREIAAQGLGYLGDARAAAPLGAALKDSDPYVRRRAAAALITVPAAGVVRELSAAAVNDQIADVRQFAVQALGWIGNGTVVAALMQATKDPSADVRREAATQLGRIADPLCLEALTALLDTKAHPDPDPDVRWAAVIALGKLRDKRAANVLVECLSDTSPQVTNSAERALQKLGIARQEKEGFRS
jgi:HEAT repeat protein